MRLAATVGSRLASPHAGEFDQALKAAERDGTAAYIEVVTDKYAAPPLAKKMHESLY